MLISGISSRLSEAHSAAQGSHTRPVSVDPVEAVQDNSGDKAATGQQLPARLDTPDSPLTDAKIIQSARMPQSAFAAQMLDQWSDDEDRSVYLLRDRAYAKGTPIGPQ